ncbi:MAG: ABC transporter ATP-binding protein [Chloroflexi bacterium]|nr:ABC transporter ATP-binding protein [Chloroflexota bacterium]
MSFFEVENLTKRFGGLVAVDNVTLRVEKDEIVGLIGPNGSGKTTLFRCILGILKPDSGKVRFKGEDVTRLRPWEVSKRGIAGTFQVVKPFRRLPVLANTVVPSLSPRSRRRGEWVKRAEGRAMDALLFVGIADLAPQLAANLSYGELKRLEIARAIATEPELLMLDEPFGGLSPPEADLMAKSLRRLHQGASFGQLHSEGYPLLIVEHKLSQLMKIVDRVIVLNFGKVIAEGRPEEVTKNEEVIKAYTGKEVFQFAPRSQRDNS